MKATRRAIAGALASALAGALPAAAQTYPARNITIVVGYAPGGTGDFIARVIGNKLSEKFGRTVVVENRAGASGLIAAEAAAKSLPDGYTLMMGSQTTLAVAPAIYRKYAVDAAKDFSGIAPAGVSPLMLVVHPAFPAQSVKDIIKMAKAKPGSLNFGSGGLGTTPHMSGELLALTAGIKLTHVAYRGEAPALNDLIGGQIPMMFSNVSAVIGNVKAGQLRALAVTSAQRIPVAPELPTIAESGLPGFEVATWFALVTPAGTPRDIVMRLNAEAKRSMHQPDAGQRLAALGMTIDERTPDELDAFIRSEIAKWGKVIRDADIKAPDGN
jgi:tripartite-type tricarboxylate transporter receptor subunit TctC